MVKKRIKSRFILTMDTLAKSDDPNDKALVKLVDESSKRTRNALTEGAADSEKFKQYLDLQSSIADSADSYLKKSRTSFQNFKSLLKNPSTTNAERLLSKLVPFNLYKPKMTPEKIANIVLDLYNNQTEHKGAVEMSHEMLKNRRELIYTIAKEAAQSIKTHSLGYMSVEAHKNKIDSLYETLKEFSERKKDPTDSELDILREKLAICTDAGLYDGNKIIERIDAKDNIKPDLYVISNDVEKARGDIGDLLRQEGLEVKGGMNLIQGLSLQKEQFESTVEAMAVQLGELEIDLRYTKELAQNTFYLAKGQGVSNAALDSFEAYRDVMNKVQTFNSLGARVMLDKVGHLMTTPFFDQEQLEQAKQEIRDAAGLYKEKEKEFHEKAKELVKAVGIKEKT